MASKKKIRVRPAPLKTRPRRRKARATPGQAVSPPLGTFKRGHATRTHDPCPYKQTKQERNVVMTDIQRALALARDKLHEAREWIRAQEGVKAVTDDERALRIATLVYRNMGKGAETRVAIDLIKRVASEGLESVADLCTAKPKGSAA